MTAEPWYEAEVLYDHGTASDAVFELIFAAQSLQEALALVESDVPAVVEDWTGEARIGFDHEMAGLVEVGHQVAALLSAAALGVDVAEDQAHEEVHLREELRAAHDAERAAAAPEAGR